MQRNPLTLTVVATMLVLMLCGPLGLAPQARAEAEIKKTWQLCTVQNRILGEEFSFYLPEGEWSVSNLTRSACTACYFMAEGASVQVHFLAVTKDQFHPGDRLYEAVFTTEAEGRQLLTAGEHLAYREENTLVIHLGDLPMEPETYYLQAVLTPEDDGKGEAYFNEMFEAILAAPAVVPLETGFPEDKLVDDSGTLFYPDHITYNGVDIPLKQVILRDACLHVQGEYEDETGALFTFYTSNIISRQSSFERNLADSQYTAASYGAFQAAEKRSYRTLYVSVWMGEYGCKFQAKYTGDETDANYEVASALVQALVASGEYRPLPEE